MNEYCLIINIMATAKCEADKNSALYMRTSLTSRAEPSLATERLTVLQDCAPHLGNKRFDLTALVAKHNRMNGRFTIFRVGRFA